MKHTETPPAKVKIGLIVLAAGASRRMCGMPKQLLELGGKTLFRRAAEVAVETEFRPVIAVLGKNFKDLQTEIADLPVETVYNRDAELIGISSSIKIALNRLADLNLDAVVISLCDQPMISAENLRALGAAFLDTKSPIVAAAYSNTHGVPALFARTLFGELANLTADEGAKKVIRKHSDETVFVSMPEAAFDVDTTEDYEKLKNIIE